MSATLQRAIAAEGGLVNAAQAAKIWGYSRTYLGKLAQRDDFPAPVASVAGRPQWAWNDLDNWHRAYLAGEI